MFNLNAIEHVFCPPPLFTDRGTLLSYNIFSVKLLNQSFSLQQQFNRSFTKKPVRTNLLLVRVNRVFGDDMALSWDETVNWSVLTEYVNTRALNSKY